MCGFIGVFDPASEFKERDMTRALEALRHRGIDDTGALRIGNTWFGHVRRAIIDREGGSQPMSSKDGRIHVVFNGEIYNHREIRNRLSDKGYVFQTRSDTEVLIHLWREKKEKLLNELLGMFSFIVWDSDLKEGIVARDRQGIKPCFVAKLPKGGVAFASEIKALRCFANVGSEVDYESLGLIHAYNYLPPPRTCYKGISHLPPGSYIKIEENFVSDPSVYWKAPVAFDLFKPDFSVFDELLDEAVSSQLEFEVDACLFLSGGVDSSILAEKLSKFRAVDTAYALKCEVAEYDEFSLAHAVARDKGFKLKPVVYSSNVVKDDWAKCLAYADQPHGDMSFILMKKLFEAASNDGFTVVFNGDGADEALGSQQNPQVLNLDEHFATINYFDADVARKVLRSDVLWGWELASSIWSEALSELPSHDPVDKVTNFEVTKLMPGNNLVKSDRMGAAFSMEGRSPFLDHRVTEYLCGLQSSVKQRGGVGKWFLKEYGSRFYSRDHMFRKKSMPTLPIGNWLQGPLYSWASDSFSKLDDRYYNIGGCLDLLREHVDGKRNHTRALRTLLAVSVWS
jgi:asparagine synthase (glutamine-hydrolysing)